MSNKPTKTYAVHHREVKKIEFDTMHHRFPMEYYIPQNAEKLTGIILLGPDPRYVENSMHFSLIEVLFRFCRTEKIAAMRINFVTAAHYTESEALLQFIVQANCAIENFKSLLGTYDKLIVVGVSGGAYVALQMLLRRYEINGAVLISPPMLHYRFDDLMIRYKTNLSIIYPLGDKNCPEHLVKLLAKCANANGMKCDATAIAAADDKYTNYEQTVWNSIMEFKDNLNYMDGTNNTE
jgi:alpha/beta superfamily hydrolase